MPRSTWNQRWVIILPSGVASPSHLFDKDWLGDLTVLSGSFLLGMLLFSGFSWVEKTENHTSISTVLYIYFKKNSDSPANWRLVSVVVKPILLLIFWWGHLNLESFTYQIAAIWQILNKKNNGSDDIREKALLESCVLKRWKRLFSKWLSVLVLARSI